MADIEVGSEVLYAEADGVVRKGFALQAGDVPDPIAVEARSDINSTVAATFVVIVGNPSAGQVALDSAGTAAAAATATVGLTGVDNNTPQPLIQSVPGPWTFDPTLGFWTHRFSNVLWRGYWASSTEMADVIVTVQDHDDLPGTGGEMTITIAAANVFVPPAPKSYGFKAQAMSLGDGSDQQITLPLIIGTAQSELRVAIDSGTANAPASAALHYQIQQIRFTI